MITSDTPSEVSVTVGDSVSIECSASGRPLPSLSWYQDGVQLNTSERIDITSNAVNSTHVDNVLTVSSVTHDDEAVYTCTATNILPNGVMPHSIDITLEVLCKCMPACTFKVSQIIHMHTCILYHNYAGYSL